METVYLGIILFVFVLAIFDLVVGVSNDAVNFLNSAVGAKVAKFKTIMVIASLGIVAGACMSNGMMDIARHGIFCPEHFSFADIMCILLAVMVTDVVLLDVFNTLGMPTSTTVSMVFELLGGTFVLALLKIVSDDTLTLGSLLNTEKALSVILGIFMSVAIAFVVGALVQWLSRVVFTFQYQQKLRWLSGLFGGIACTAIAYFVFVKGLGKTPFISPDVRVWIDSHTCWLLCVFFAASAVLMQILNALGVNIFRIIILMGTFGLAMAFAGNDLVNFIGVPLAGLSAYEDWSLNAGGDMDYLMGSLNENAQTPFVFLLAAGLVMILALVTSKKARNVIKTSVDLSRQDDGDEMFGSSGMARYLVRAGIKVGESIERFVPVGVRRWVDKRFDTSEAVLADGAAFDLVRASINLVLAAMLIIMGTSLKLPLSTTYVTFMVAMGTSLADRAWSRESAVYRITGVLSVIGGWFLTAAVAFAICGAVTLIMHFGGVVAMIALVALAAILLIRSNITYRSKMRASAEDTVFAQMMRTKDKECVWQLVNQHLDATQTHTLDYATITYSAVINAVCDQNRRLLRLLRRELRTKKDEVKKLNRQAMLGMRRLDAERAVVFNMWYHLGANSTLQIVYGLIRMADTAYEHFDNNFSPLSDKARVELGKISVEMVRIMGRVRRAIAETDFQQNDSIKADCEALKDYIGSLRKSEYGRLHSAARSEVKACVLYISLLQEAQELVNSLKRQLRANSKFEEE